MVIPQAPDCNSINYFALLFLGKLAEGAPVQGSVLFRHRI
jgi:hypothetical protein